MSRLKNTQSISNCDKFTLPKVKALWHKKERVNTVNVNSLLVHLYSCKSDIFTYISRQIENQSYQGTNSDKHFNKKWEKPSFSLRLIECTAASERIRRLPIAVDDKLCITLKEIINMTHSALAFAVGE